MGILGTVKKFTQVPAINDINMIESSTNYFALVSSNTIYIYGRHPEKLPNFDLLDYDHTKKEFVRFHARLESEIVHKIVCSKNKLVLWTDNGLYVLSDFYDSHFDTSSNSDTQTILPTIFNSCAEIDRIIDISCDDEKILIITNDKVYVENFDGDSWEDFGLDLNRCKCFLIPHTTTLIAQVILGGAFIAVICSFTSDGEMKTVPFPFNLKGFITNIFIDEYMSVIWFSDREVYCWGNNNFGQLGVGHFETIHEYVQNNFLTRHINLPT